jgi:hypothetical protein
MEGRHVKRLADQPKPLFIRKTLFILSWKLLIKRVFLYTLVDGRPWSIQDTRVVKMMREACDKAFFCKWIYIKAALTSDNRIDMIGIRYLIYHSFFVRWYVTVIYFLRREIQCNTV